jgi:T-complex protein 1 subunit eta
VLTTGPVCVQRTSQPKKFSDPLICLLNVELELKSEKDNAEVRIKDVAVRTHHKSPRALASLSVCPIQPFDIVLCLMSHTQDYQAFVDAEWKIIYDKLDAIVATGAKVVLSRLAIGDLATQYFADRDIFCAGRVAEDVRLTFVLQRGCTCYG